MRGNAVRIIAALTVVTLIITFPTKADSDQQSSLRDALNEIIANEGGASTTKAAEPATPTKPAAAASEMTPAPAAPPVVQPAETTAAPKIAPAPAAKPMPATPQPVRAKSSDGFPSIILIVDRSASMIGYFKWVQYDVKNMINALPEGAEFRIVLLGQKNTEGQFPKAGFAKSSMASREQAAEWVDGLKAEEGTDGAAAVTAAMKDAGEKQTQMVLFSDGGFLRPSAMLDLAKTIGEKDNLSLNTRLYGSATRTSQSLMQNLARVGGGAFQFVTLIK